MKIHSIANSPYFGYNKELNEKVNQKLKKAKGNRDIADTLLALNTYCMETEDKLRKAEKEKKFGLLDYYNNLFLDSKVNAINCINERFPNLNYRKTELESYEKEAELRKIKNPNNWMNQLIFVMRSCAEADEVFSEIEQAVENANQEGVSPKDAIKSVIDKRFNIEESTPESKEISSKRSKEAKKSDKVNKTLSKKQTEVAELVELFQPKDYSAKGFISIGGMEELKDKINDKIIQPLRDPKSAKLDEIEYGKKFPRGELLYGPPGCGKTYFAEAIAQETGLPMYKIKVSRVGSQYVNGGANNLQAAYSYIKDIADSTGKPVLMFMDEIETLTPKRDESGKHNEDNKLLGTFLQIIDEARNDNIFIIGATNLVNMIDPAIASRFDNKDYVGMPDAATRATVLGMMLNRFTKGQSLAENKVALNELAKQTAGFSNRTLGVLVSEAADIARKDARRPLIIDDFKEPIKRHLQDKITNESIYTDKVSMPKIGFSNIH